MHRAKTFFPKKNFSKKKNDHIDPENDASS